MISLYDIIEASNGQLFGEPAAQIFTEFCLDASQAGENALFLAVRTDRGDTHVQIADAIARGVSGVVCMRPPDCDTTGVTVILVRDTADAMLAWARYILGKLGPKVIGVTGSVGKSIAVEAIGRVLGLRHSVHISEVQGDGRLSVPQSLARLNNAHKFVVLKLTTTQPGEMATMVQSVQPVAGVVTSAGDLGGDNFEGPEQVAKEHGVLVTFLSPTGLAVLNYNDDYVRSLAGRTRARVRTMGIDSFSADMMAYNVVMGIDGTGFDLRFGGERYLGQYVPLLGREHLNSIMAALLIGNHFDVPIAEALRVLADLPPLPGQMNLLPGENDSLLIDDTYNANVQSTLSALDWVAAVKGSRRGRTFFIMGDISDAGSGAGKSGYRTIGQKVAGVVDVFITQGMDAAQAARAVLDQHVEGRQVHTTYSAQDTVALLERTYRLTPDDIVLLKGGAAMRMELVTQALLRDEADRVRLPRQHTLPEIVTLYQPTRPSWVEIDAMALGDNVRALKAMIGADVTLMAVVKADGYGHGAALSAQTALLNGASHLGVSSLQEALELREAGINAPILVMNYMPAYLARQAIRHNITATIYDLDLARACDRAAREIGGRLKAHIKVDTGMGRLGIMPDDTIPLFRQLNALPGLEIEGIYTHFSVADEDPAFTQSQLNAFRNVIRPLQATTGFRFKYIHACNSAAAFSTPDAHFNLIRAGLAMYGLHPSDQVRLPAEFRPALSWKTVIAQVKQLPAGHPVGYGNTYITAQPEQVAVIPVGYGDGFRRAPHHWGEVLVHGQRAPILGRVSMEKTVISVEAIPGVSIGDEVVLVGRQGDEAITAEDVAARLGTSNYEVVCSVLARVPRR